VFGLLSNGIQFFTVEIGFVEVLDEKLKNTQIVHAGIKSNRHVDRYLDMSAKFLIMNFDRKIPKKSLSRH
jgi:hypothetical protein